MRNRTDQTNELHYGEIGVLYGFRVFLIFMVAQFHFWQQSWLNKSVKLFGITIGGYVFHNTGYLFVDGFLLLSGFLLYLPYARGRYTGIPEPGIKEFYFRRFRRIVPSYVFAVIGSLVLAIVPVMRYASIGELVADVASHLTFTQLFFEKTYYGSPLNGALWTVVVEVQFYLLFPLLVKALHKHSGLTLTTMAVIGLGFRWCTACYANGSQMLMNQLPAFLDVIALGMSMALLVAWIEQKKSTYTGLINVTMETAAISGIVLGIALLVRMTNHQAVSAQVSYDALHISQLTLRLPFTAVLAFIMLCSMQLPRFIRFLFDNQLMRFLSGISMNFYFWHQVLAVQLRQYFYPNVDELHSQPLQQGAYELLCWCAALLLAMVLTYGIEKPAGKWLTRVWRERESNQQQFL